MQTEAESRSRKGIMCDLPLRRMRRDYMFHELYSDNHSFTRPCWIIYVALCDYGPIHLQFQYLVITPTARTLASLGVPHISPYSAWLDSSIFTPQVGTVKDCLVL
jgi:hypothetical protein